MSLRVIAPGWGRAAALFALVCAATLPATAQPKNKRADKSEKADKASSTTEPAATPAAKPETRKGPVKEQNFNFDGLGLNGRSRSPQLLYFLERANEELERASLEKRSFIPHMVRTVEEEAL
jgi:hypothetical protein